MALTKFFIALALFVTSATFEHQVVQTADGLDASWSVSVSMTKSMATERYAAQY